jgi:hypothetical protein
MSWKIKRSHDPHGEPDALVARLHPIVFALQQRLRADGHPSQAIDVLRTGLVCFEAASSHALGLGWPTTDVSEYYGDGPDPADVDVVEQLAQVITEGVAPDVLIRASSVFKHCREEWEGDADVQTYGERCTAITKALLKCLDLPDALQTRPS